MLAKNLIYKAHKELSGFQAADSVELLTCQALQNIFNLTLHSEEVSRSSVI
jgi:hypothetical protein